MPKLRVIDGTKPPPAPHTMVVCECGSRTFTPATTGLIRNAQGKIIKGPGTHAQWVCSWCRKPAP